MAFEVYPYDHDCVPSRQRLGITLNKHSQLHMNGATCAALGLPSHVRLLYDRATRAIGVQASGEGERHALRVSSPHGGPRSRRVSAKGFCAYFDVQSYRGRWYRGELRDGMLYVPLDDQCAGTSTTIEYEAARSRDILPVGALSLSVSQVRAGAQRQGLQRRGGYRRRKGLAES